MFVRRPALYGREETRSCRFERGRDPLQDVKRDVPFALFDLRDDGPRDPRSLGEVRLGEP